MVVWDRSAVLKAIESNYKSLREPDFSFVSNAVSARPYDSLIDKIHEFCDIEEITDTNDDVSFRYVISKSNEQWIIELSMLGLYATVLRIFKAGDIKLVTQNASAPEDKDIVSLLLKSDFQILGKSELEEALDLKLFNTEPGNVRIYQALFSDTDVLPWSV